MQTLYRLPMTIRLAQTLSRVTTWGIRNEQRRELLLESDQDWELMYSDQGPRRVLVRAVQGIPMAIWTRMEDRDRTALPAAIAFAILAVAAAGAALLERTYPSALRWFTLLSATGVGLASLTMTRHPRRIPLRRLRIPMLALSVGFLGMTYNMPDDSDWGYASPVVETTVGDALIAIGFTAIGIGCFLVVVASFVAAPRTLLHIGGIGIVSGAVLFGTGQLIWGIVAVTVDPLVTATSVPIGLGAYSLAHVTPRLRHLVTG